jgi:hypothetical protein
VYRFPRLEAVIRDLPLQRGLIQKEKCLALDMLLAPGPLVPPRRQLNLAVPFQCEQEVPACPVFEPAVELGLVPLPAQGLGDGGAAQSPFLVNAAAARVRSGPHGDFKVLGNVNGLSRSCDGREKKNHY